MASESRSVGLATSLLSDRRIEYRDSWRDSDSAALEFPVVSSPADQERRRNVSRRLPVAHRDYEGFDFAVKAQREPQTHDRGRHRNRDGRRQHLAESLREEYAAGAGIVINDPTGRTPR